MNVGWIKIHRKMLDWEWFSDLNTAHFFLYCLLKANTSDKAWQGKIIQKGSFISSRAKMAAESGLSVSCIRTAQKKLESTGELTSDSTNGYTLVTICNYDKYQIVEYSASQTSQQTDDKRIANESQTNRKRIATTKEINNNNNNNNNNKECENARAREEEFLDGVLFPVKQLTDEIIEECKNGGNAIVSLQRLYGITAEQISEAALFFADHLTAGGVTMKSRGDYRRHFNSWLRINVKQLYFDNGNNGNKTNTTGRAIDNTDLLARIAAGLQPVATE